MHRQVSVSVRLYNHLYPRPRPEDPTNFSGHLSKHLIPEIRVETALYYGDLLTIESRYPGLNYTYEPHIRRLSRFPHHARLFQAVKAIGITDCEILELAKWEGTLWARQRYEKDEGIKVLDTTGDDIPRWVNPGITIRTREVSADEDSLDEPMPTQTSTGVTTPLTAPCDNDARDAPADRPHDAPRLPSSVFDEESSDENSDASASESEPAAPQSRPHDAPSSPRESGLSRHLRETVSHHRRNLPGEVRTMLLELVNTLRLNRSVSTPELDRLRRDIFDRLSQMQAQMPSTTFINIISAVTLLIEQHLRNQQAASRASRHVSTTNLPIISPPAA